MIIINAVRFLAVILLVSILIVKEIPFRNLFKDLMIQFYLALSCVLILLIIDNIFGFILSLCLLALYFRIYTSELKSKKEMIPSNTSNTSNTSNHNHNNCSNDKCVMNMERVGIERKKTLEVITQDNSLVPYITEENLLAAQSNIVNPEEYNKEIYGVDKGIYNEDVYGSQGLDNKNIHMRGYDVNNEYLGSLSYGLW
jgi:Ca2+/Na+ antiporter